MDWKEKLNEVVRTSKHHTQGQRFGQLIYNAIANTDDIRDIEEYDSNFCSRLFFIEDSELAEDIISWLTWLDNNTPQK